MVENTATTNKKCPMNLAKMSATAQRMKSRVQTSSKKMKMPHPYFPVIRKPHRRHHHHDDDDHDDHRPDDDDDDRIDDYGKIRINKKPKVLDHFPLIKKRESKITMPEIAVVDDSQSLDGHYATGDQAYSYGGFNNGHYNSSWEESSENSFDR
eukprot:scaffold7169_cov107-Cylindrotheca_fusiformis.AAC.6